MILRRISRIKKINLEDTIDLEQLLLNKPKIDILIGFPGSGKTTYAKNVLQNKNSIYLSSDDTRIELFGFEDQTQNQRVFEVMHYRALKALKEGKNVIFDATNLSRKKRMNFINEIQKIKDIEINAYLFCIPISELFERNLIRTERTIPYEKLLNMLRNIDIPLYYEGFDNIYLVNNSYLNYTYDEKWFYNVAKNYDQHNPYHNRTLLDHTLDVVSHLEDNDNYFLGIDRWILKKAAFFHDFGKVYTQSCDEKGIYHYYNHEKVSAYIWLYNICINNLLDDKRRVRVNDSAYQVACLISHHMDFYKSNLEKTDKLFNDKDLFNMLKELHKADEKR